MFLLSPVKNSLCFCFHQSRIVCVDIFTSQEYFVFMFSPVKNNLCLCFHQSRSVYVSAFTSQE